MNRTTTGLLVAVLAAASFGMSGAFIKPLLVAGWSPAAAVTFRALVGGLVLVPFALVALRGRWSSLWRARWRILLMASVGVSGTQLVYFAALQRIPVSTAILIEYMAPLLLVTFVWARSRRMPRVVVLVGSAVAMAGLFFVVSPGGGGALDPLGLVFAAVAADALSCVAAAGARNSTVLRTRADAVDCLAAGCADAARGAQKTVKSTSSMSNGATDRRTHGRCCVSVCMTARGYRESLRARKTPVDRAIMRW